MVPGKHEARSATTSPASRGPRRGLLGVLLLWCALASLLGTAACAGTSRYEVLSFFFDGVPDPSRPDSRRTAQAPAGPLSLAERDELLRARIKQVSVFAHKPFAEHRCESCHKQESGRRQSTEAIRWSLGTNELLAPPDVLCGKCHKPSQERYQHGPAAARMCTWCHVPHTSQFPHLLKTRTAQELCQQCHRGETLATADKHAEFLGKRDCTECHDPHASPLASLLRPTPVSRPAPEAPPVQEPRK